MHREKMKENYFQQSKRVATLRIQQCGQTASGIKSAHYGRLKISVKQGLRNGLQ